MFESRAEKLAKIVTALKNLARERESGNAKAIAGAIQWVDHTLDGVSPTGEGAELVLQAREAIATATTHLARLRIEEERAHAAKLQSHVVPCRHCGGIEMLVAEGNLEVNSIGGSIDCVIVVCQTCSEMRWVAKDPTELAQRSASSLW